MLLVINLLIALFLAPVADAQEFHWIRGGDHEASRAELKSILRQAGLEYLANPNRDKDLQPNLESDEDPLNRIDEYLEEVILRAESLDIGGTDGRMTVRMRFDAENLRFSLGTEETRSYGQIYAVDLAREVSFDVFTDSGQLTAGTIRGLTFQVKLPMIPDAVRLTRMAFNIENQIASIYASAVYDVVQLVARASVRFRRFEGVEWFSPFLGSLPSLFEGVRFWPRAPADAQRLGMSTGTAESL